MKDTTLLNEKQSFKAISGAFNRALETLRIDPNRFRSLPIRQRKLALLDAISRTADNMAQDVDWISDRSEFYDKSIWDYSPDEIRLHQTFVDMYIALACLGETNSILPLITYMGFPEPRWSIVIEPVLKVLAKKMTTDSLYRLPTISEKYRWRSWGISHSNYFSLQDYGDMLMAEIGPETVKRYRHAPVNPSNLTLAINYRQEPFGLKKKIYNESQANYCTYILYPELEKRNFSKFALLLNEYLDNNKPERNFNTVVSCVNDYLDEINLSNDELKWLWLKNLPSESINPRTWVVLYKISAAGNDNKKLATTFAKKIAGSKANYKFILVISDVLMKSRSKDSIYGLANILSNANSISNEESQTFSALRPEILETFATWLSNIISTEIESTWIIESEQPAKRLKLSMKFKNIFEENDRQMFNVCKLEKSSDIGFQGFTLWLNELYDLRQTLRKELNKDAPVNSLSDRYKKILQDLKNKLSSSSKKLDES